MTLFTDSPYEYLMTQRPYAGKAADAGPPPYPPESRCAGCPYGSGKPCIGVCMKKLLSQSKKHGKGGAELGKDT